MAMSMQALLFLGFVIGFIKVASAASGTATFYTEYLPSACYGNEDQGVMIAAASPAIFNNKAACGTMYSVRCTGATNKGPHPCTGNSVTVKVVDLCSPCQGTIDLSQDAFSQIANLDAGNVKIQFDQV